MKNTNISELYSKDYFLAGCGGFEYWKKYKGKNLDPRLKHSFKLGNINEKMRVLDFGFGRGELLINSALNGAECHGIDLSKDAIAIAKGAIRLLPNTVRNRISLNLLNKSILPFKENFFDVIFFVDVIEHLTQEEVERFLKEFNRVLKPRGSLIVHTAPNKNYYDIGYKYYSKFVFDLVDPIHQLLFKEKINRNLRNERHNIYHVNEQTPNSLKKNLINAGFNSKVWASDYPEMISIKNFKSFIKYLFFVPCIVPFLKPFFSYNVWAIAKKKLSTSK
ncbi:class I SAM-dependent methyltransferase [Candidatus Micrarchaeota archaeon]|nr:class I SAM-dependent methyltransferase [Candidatus Micrarchaeota archaeon]